MTLTMDTDRWLEILGRDYLRDYLPAGGSSVKFAVCADSEEARAASERVLELARQRAFLTASVSAAHVKLPLIEKLFCAIADQIPWGLVVTRVLCDFAREQNWSVPESIDPDRGLVAQLDERNALGHQQISLVLQRECGRQILKDRSLAKEFRLAMMWLARDRLEGGENAGVATRQLTDWLGGRLTAIGNLRPYQTHTRSRARTRGISSVRCSPSSERRVFRDWS